MDRATAPDRQAPHETVAALTNDKTSDTTHPAWIALLIVVSLSLSVVFFRMGGGIRTGGDTSRYLDGANCLLARKLPPDKGTSYLGYEAVVALNIVVGSGLGGVIVLQWVFAALAAVAQYDLGRQLGGTKVALLSAAVVVANPDLCRWQSFILTDSLYISFLILTIWVLHRASVDGARGQCAAAVLLAVATALIRPNGWIMPPIALAYLALHQRGKPRIGWLVPIVTAFVFVISAAAFPPFRNAIQEEHPDMMLRRGEVVWGYPAWRLAMPADPVASAEDWPSALGYVGRHPLACLYLAGLRVLAELAHFRPFYSTRHNAAFLVVLPPLYFLATIGFIRTRRHALAQLLAAIVAGHLLIIALTFADWDGRFLLYFLPAIGVFAATGLACLISPDQSRKMTSAIML
jgi:4-amino-4-deoxy-L-arabinose transferase-like glycosyltransferase